MATRGVVNTTEETGKEASGKMRRPTDVERALNRGETARGDLHDGGEPVRPLPGEGEPLSLLW